MFLYLLIMGLDQLFFDQLTESGKMVGKAIGKTFNDLGDAIDQIEEEAKAKEVQS